jgi:hypothetical protein
MKKNPGSDSRAAQRNLNRHAIVCQAYRAALDSQVGPPLTPHPQHTHTIHHTAQRRSNAQTSAERMQPIRCGPVAKPLARAEADALFGPSGKRRGRRGSFAFGSGRAGRARRREIEGLKAEGTRERESGFFFCLIIARVPACLRACVPACCLSALSSARRAVSLSSRGCADSARRSTTTMFRRAAGAKGPNANGLCGACYSKMPCLHVGTHQPRSLSWPPTATTQPVTCPQSVRVLFSACNTLHSPITACALAFHCLLPCPTGESHSPAILA